MLYTQQASIFMYHKVGLLLNLAGKNAIVLHIDDDFQVQSVHLCFLVPRMHFIKIAICQC